MNMFALTLSALLSVLVVVTNQLYHVECFAPLRVIHSRGVEHTTVSPMLMETGASPLVLRSRKPALTWLHMVSDQEEEQQQKSLNFGIVAQSLGTQAIMGSTIWTGGAGYELLSKQFNIGIPSVAYGLVGLAALVLFSRRVETSESPFVAGLNLSTNMAVLRIFGSESQPAVALIVSLVLGLVTGLVEETTFRGLILNSLAGSYGIINAAAFSTFIFAFLHTNPTGFLQQGEQRIDNFVLLGFQLVTGSIFCLLYLGSGGNLAVPIVAHALYDTWTFFKTHLDVTGQMEYANESSELPLGTVARKWEELKDKEFVQSARETFYLMDTNRDGMLSRKELRIALFSYGINLSKIQSDFVAKKADTDQSGEIDFDEFLEFVGPAGSTGKAVRNAILGNQVGV